jgi:hypothetical protein
MPSLGNYWIDDIYYDARLEFFTYKNRSGRILNMGSLNSPYIEMFYAIVKHVTSSPRVVTLGNLKEIADKSDILLVFPEYVDVPVDEIDIKVFKTQMSEIISKAERTKRLALNYVFKGPETRTVSTYFKTDPTGSKSAGNNPSKVIYDRHQFARKKKNSIFKDF